MSGKGRFNRNSLYFPGYQGIGTVETRSLQPASTANHLGIFKSLSLRGTCPQKPGIAHQLLVAPAYNPRLSRPEVLCHRRQLKLKLDRKSLS